MAGQHDARPGLDEDLEQVAGVGHGAPLAPGSRDGQQMVVQREDLQVAGRRELLHDPVVLLAPDLALVEVGLARVHAHDADAAHVAHPAPRADQLLEVEVADVARVVVPGNDRQRRLHAVEVGNGDLVLLPVSLVGEVARAEHQVRLQLVQLDDHPVHQVGNEEGRADVQVGDVGDRDHDQVSLRPPRV